MIWEARDSLRNLQVAWVENLGLVAVSQELHVNGRIPHIKYMAAVPGLYTHPAAVPGPHTHPARCIQLSYRVEMGWIQQPAGV